MGSQRIVTTTDRLLEQLNAITAVATAGKPENGAIVVNGEAISVTDLTAKITTLTKEVSDWKTSAKEIVGLAEDYVLNYPEHKERLVLAAKGVKKAQYDVQIPTALKTAKAALAALEPKSSFPSTKTLLLTTAAVAVVAAGAAEYQSGVFSSFLKPFVESLMKFFGSGNTASAPTPQDLTPEPGPTPQPVPMPQDAVPQPGPTPAAWVEEPALSKAAAFHLPEINNGSLSLAPQTLLLQGTALPSMPGVNLPNFTREASSAREASEKIVNIVKKGAEEITSQAQELTSQIASRLINLPSAQELLMSSLQTMDALCAKGNELASTVVNSVPTLDSIKKGTTDLLNYLTASKPAQSLKDAPNLCGFVSEHASNTSQLKGPEMHPVVIGERLTANPNFARTQTFSEYAESVVAPLAEKVEALKEQAAGFVQNVSQTAKNVSQSLGKTIQETSSHYAGLISERATNVSQSVGKTIKETASQFGIPLPAKSTMLKIAGAAVAIPGAAYLFKRAANAVINSQQNANHRRPQRRRH